MPQIDSKFLSDLSPGQRGRIAALSGALHLRQRLREMGLTVGAEVELVRRAPLGDPLDVRIRGYHMSLRRSEAEVIKIDACSEAATATSAMP